MTSQHMHALWGRLLDGEPVVLTRGADWVELSLSPAEHDRSYLREGTIFAGRIGQPARERVPAMPLDQLHEYVDTLLLRGFVPFDGSRKEWRGSSMMRVVGALARVRDLALGRPEDVAPWREPDLDLPTTAMGGQAELDLARRNPAPRSRAAR